MQKDIRPWLNVSFLWSVHCLQCWASGFDGASPFFFFFWLPASPSKGTKVADLRAREGVPSQEIKASVLVALTLQEKGNALYFRIGWGSDETQVSESLLLISALPASQLLPPQAIISCSISWGVYKAGTLGLCVQQKEKPTVPQLFHCLAMFLSYYCSFS